MKLVSAIFQLQIWSISHQCELLRVACGGWKRAHSCLLGATPSTSATFVYVKDGVLHGVGGLRSLEDHDSQERSNTHARSLHMCHHGREVQTGLRYAFFICWHAYGDTTLTYWARRHVQRVAGFVHAARLHETDVVILSFRSGRGYVHSVG